MIRLELELQQVKSQRRSASDISNAAIENISTRLAAAVVEPVARSRKQNSAIPLTSKYFISACPVPYLTSQTWDETKAGHGEESSLGPISIFSVPRHVIDTMLRHYCEFYRPQYPAIEESELYNACDRVYENAEPSDFDNFCVHITLAISVSSKHLYVLIL